MSLWHDWKWHILLGIGAIALCISLFLSTPVPGESAAAQQRPAAAVFPHPFALAEGAIQADAAIVYDPATGAILYQKNAELPLPLASLAKLMAADVVLAKEDPAVRVSIDSEATSQINDPGDIGVKAGQTWALGALVRYGLYASSNNAMLAAAGAAGGRGIIDAMNARARALGLTGSHFYDATGLDVNAKLAGGYGSARDMALLAADFYRSHPSYFEDTMSAAADFNPGAQELLAEPTAAPIADIPGVLAAKTGYTDLARGNMVALFDAGLDHPLVAVVLHSTKEGRFQDIRTLINAARFYSEH